MFKSHMTSHFILAIAGLAAGLLNSVAGGGSFLTFPALIFTGVPSIIANASSTMALIPAVDREFARVRDPDDVCVLANGLLQHV